jgi:hypothetical protein
LMPGAEVPVNNQRVYWNTRSKYSSFIASDTYRSRADGFKRLRVRRWDSAYGGEIFVVGQFPPIGFPHRRRHRWQDGTVATARPDTVPNPEWVQMYRDGLSRGLIAELTGTPPATVGYHLRMAKTVDPGLRSAHETAAAPKTTRVTYQGLDPMKELIGFVQETGRYPSQSASDLSERTLAAWFKRRRSEANAGTLAPAYRDGLSVLPGWEGTPRAILFQTRWQERLAALVAYRAAGNDWPLHEGTTGEEHELGVWLHRQRFELRRGELNPRKAAALDAAVPGWLTGGKSGSPANEARWQDRLAALVSYLAPGQDWPRYKAEAGSEEHRLGVWLQVQRNTRRQGKLAATRAEALNATLRGWRAGRPQGRKPKTQSSTNITAPAGNDEPETQATA